MKALSYLNSQVLSVSNWYVFQKMNIKFALAFISLIRPDQKTVSYDNLYSTLVKTHPHLSNMTIQQQQHLESDLGVNHKADLNIQMLHKLLSLYKPDLNIVTEDEKILKTYKLLLGLASKHLGDIFLHEDFATESETTVIVPFNSQDMKHFLKSIADDGTESSEELLHIISTLTSPDEKMVSMEIPCDNDGTISFHHDIKEMDPDVLKEDQIKGEVEAEEDQTVLISFSRNNAKSDNSNMNWGPGQCNICEKEVKNLEQHIRAVHSERKYACHHCSYKASSNFNLKLHISKIHLEVKDLKKDEEDARHPPEEQPPSRGLKLKEKKQCPHCLKFKLYYDTHVAKCLESQKLSATCEECGKAFKKPYLLKLHIQNVHKPKVYHNCDKCVYRTSDKVALWRHLKEHETGLIMITCHICGKKIKGNRKANLQDHIQRVHENENGGKCNICGKETKNVKAHIKTVHSERKFACHICSYKASSSFNLKLHISKTHLGLKELEKEQCPHCEVVTTNLKFHLKKYHIDACLNI